MKMRSPVAVAIFYFFLFGNVSAGQAQGAHVSNDSAAFSEQLSYIRKEWARIKYGLTDKDEKLDAIHKLEDEAKAMSLAHPDRPEAIIWEGIVLSTDAGIVKGLSALGKAKEAKSLFEQSLKMGSSNWTASAHACLGSLYYQVPGWPVGFGSDKKAELHLKKALELAPDDIDANYFYGDYLLRNDRDEEAKHYLKKALAAPDRPGRPVADAGRRQEIRLALESIK